MRFLAMVMVLVLALPHAADAAQRKVVTVKPNTRTASQDANFDPQKYAAIIMDARTGEVIHARNADATRYPASLTKMMTLYLLFEALEQKKLTTKSTMAVSALAARQPQTNISLRAGERIPVDTAIRALVVRSANDVAVVVAERLGGSVENFAKQMTAKARSLGMQNTIYRNPHGLPDYAQKTTARDMAKLSIALRRDFPQYYHYFSVRQFSWKKVSYYTHNRVMMRYAGVDGIKTGYINASGFNVASSLRRNGRDIIGVVFGGRTAAARDDRMIALIENAEQILEKRGNTVANLQPRNMPTPIAAPAPTPAAVPKPVVADRGIVHANPVPVTVAEPAPVPTAQVPAVQPNAPFAIQSQSDSAAMRMQRPRAAAATGRWGIQVGAFEDRGQAEQAVRRAASSAASALQGAQDAVAGVGAAGKTIYRARMENLSEDQARNACQLLISQQSPCFIYRAD